MFGDEISLQLNVGALVQMMSFTLQFYQNTLVGFHQRQKKIQISLHFRSVTQVLLKRKVLL